MKHPKITINARVPADLHAEMLAWMRVQTVPSTLTAVVETAIRALLAANPAVVVKKS